MILSAKKANVKIVQDPNNPKKKIKNKKKYAKLQLIVYQTSHETKVTS